MTRSPILRVQNYSKQFALHEQGTIIPASQQVNLEVFSGQLTALVGPTGSGKSSVLKGIYRTYLPSSGSLHYLSSVGEEVDLASLDEHEVLALRRSEIAFVTQFLHFLPRQCSEDVVAQPLVKRGVPWAQAREQARELLEAMNIPQRLWGVSPATFSGGEKQRVNLARGLVLRPRLLLLDEPTASLDPATTELVIDLLQDMKLQGVAMLAIFHQPELVERLADYVVELRAPATLNNSKEASL